MDHNTLIISHFYYGGGYRNPPLHGTVKNVGARIPSLTVGVRKWLIKNPDREGGDLTNQWPNRFFHSPVSGGLR